MRSMPKAFAETRCSWRSTARPFPRISLKASCLVTGALRLRAPAAEQKGKFQKADGGTLFLDEVGDMRLKTQSKVLRTLDEHASLRSGSAGDLRWT